MQLVDALVTTLKEWGIGQVFGVSGANIEHLHDSIHRLGEDKLVSIMTKSEVGAAFMADAKARTDRTLGVCCATSGGGMMNLAVGIAESFSESVPVLALVGQIPTTLEGRGGFQDSSGIGRTVDAMGMWQSMTKYAARLDDPERFWDIFHEAAYATVSGRQGPAVLLIPRDMYEREVGPRPASFPRSLQELRPPQALPSGAETRELFEAIRQSTHPVFILGTGVDRCQQPDAITDFIKRCGAPVATTMANPGAFDNSHHQYMGTVGVAGHPSAHDYINHVADLIVVVGSGLSSMARGPLAAGFERARVAAVNLDIDAVNRSVALDITVGADAGAAFVELGALLRKSPFHHQVPRGYRRTRFRAIQVPTKARPDNSDALLQSEALAILQNHLPTDGNVFFDAGNCAAAGLHYLDIPSRVTSTIALGMGGMGYAIAGAIGAQTGRPRSERSMVLCGDGAFLMHGLEVHTAVELGLPILFVVFNNSKHGMCVTRQELYFAGRLECSAYAPVSIENLARGFGGSDRLWVGQASTSSELAEQLRSYEQESISLPGVLELTLPYEESPPFTPFLGKDAMTYPVAVPTRPTRQKIQSVA